MHANDETHIVVESQKNKLLLLISGITFQMEKNVLIILMFYHFIDMNLKIIISMVYTISALYLGKLRRLLT